MSRREEILNILEQERDNLPLPTKKIAELLEMDLSNCSKVLKRLASQGLIILNRRQEGKRRITYVSLPIEVTGGNSDLPVVTTGGSVKLPVVTTSGNSDPSGAPEPCNHDSLDSGLPPVVTTSGKLPVATTSGELPVVTTSGKLPVVSKRLKEILQTKKPKSSKDRKQVTNWYLKRQILDAFQTFFNIFDEHIKIIYEEEG